MPSKLGIKTEFLSIALVLASFILGAYFYVHFPDRIITHWDLTGQPNGYGSRTVGAFALPVILVGIYILLLVLPWLDPKHDRYQSFARIYNIFKNIILAIIFAIYVITGWANLGHQVNISVTIPLLIGLLFVVLGNYMGKIKQNWFVGVRTPWTLSNENVWNKSNRMAGRLMMLCGLFLMFSVFFSPIWRIVAIILSSVVIAFGSIIYSYISYRRVKS